MDGDKKSAGSSFLPGSSVPMEAIPGPAELPAPVRARSDVKVLPASSWVCAFVCSSFLDDGR